MLDYHGSPIKISTSSLKWIQKTVNGWTKVNGIIQQFSQNKMVKAPKNYVETVRKYRYEFMYYVGEHEKQHVSMNDDESSDMGTQIPSMSSMESLLSLGHTIKFIDYWLQCFEVNYQNIIMIYKKI